MTTIFRHDHQGRVRGLDWDAMFGLGNPPTPVVDTLNEQEKARQHDNRGWTS